MLLQDRYQNKKKPLTQETAKDLRQLLEAVEEQRQALEKMEKQGNQKDVFLGYLNI